MTTNPDHSDTLSALRRIEGQVRGVQRMVDEKQYCIDILNQIAAVKGALGSVEKRILERHFNGTSSTASKTPWPASPKPTPPKRSTRSWISSTSGFLKMDISVLQTRFICATLFHSWGIENRGLMVLEERALL
ncbi:MAG: metal-sensitive transcriptional regulator [Planctomycetota bacterium]|jgi:DNA-binding FrmR family transcriptional regulator